MAERDVLGQSVDVERVTSHLRQSYDVHVAFKVEDFRGDEYRGSLDKSVTAILTNTTREGEHVPVSREKLDADMVAEVMEGAKELIADFPDHYLPDDADYPGDFGKFDVQILEAEITESQTVRQVKA